MTKQEKRFIALSLAAAALLIVPQQAHAMHIMEGYLPPASCVLWGAACLPFLAVGAIRLKQAAGRQMLLLAMAGLSSSWSRLSRSPRCSAATAT